MVDLETLVQEKIEADADFQTEIAEMSDEDKSTKLEEKRKEILSVEFERLSKADELAKNYKTRAEKAEAEAKKQKQPTGEETPKNAQQGDLSSKDLFALMKSNVHEDDIEEVVEYAKFKKITVAEALKTPLMQSTLKDNDEKRKTADATNTNSVRSSKKTVSAQQILKDARDGKIPDSGSSEAEELFWARRGGRR